MSVNIQQILKQGKAELNNYSAPEAEQLIMILFQEWLGINRTHFIAYPDTKLSISDYNQMIEGIKRIKNDEPIQHIVGYAEFYDLKFKVNSNVLIPRPETEELVDWIISTNKKVNPVVLDVGTGSGCIAISLSNGIANSQVNAVDVSVEALNLAIENAKFNQVSVDFIQADILENAAYDQLPSKLDILVSNPPYVTQKQKELMHNNVLDYDPHLALFVSDDNPLIFYKRIAEVGNKLLQNKGLLFFEINEEYGAETIVILQQLGYTEIELRKDINGKDRMVKAMKLM